MGLLWASPGVSEGLAGWPTCPQNSGGIEPEGSKPNREKAGLPQW